MTLMPEKKIYIHFALLSVIYNKIHHPYSQKITLKSVDGKLIDYINKVAYTTMQSNQVYRTVNFVNSSRDKILCGSQQSLTSLFCEEKKHHKRQIKKLF